MDAVELPNEQTLAEVFRVISLFLGSIYLNLTTFLVERKQIKNSVFLHQNYVLA